MCVLFCGASTIFHLKNWWPFSRRYSIRFSHFTLMTNIGVARILYGGAIFPHKSFFYSSLSKYGLQLIIQLQIFQSKKCPKNWLLLRLGVHLVCWGCTYKFSLWITPKNFFSALRVQIHPLQPCLRLWWQTLAWQVSRLSGGGASNVAGREALCARAHCAHWIIRSCVTWVQQATEASLISQHKSKKM